MLILHVLHPKEHLEEWRTTLIPLRLQHLYQLLKGDILMGIGSQRHFLHPSQHLDKAR
jgi:hypothetical protein